ncbi:MAG: PLP-dependent aminotransferase family protein [Kineosporiaceae bacterium]
MTVPDDVRRRLATQTSQLWGEPGVIDLGIGQPQDALLPVEEFRRALAAAPVPAYQLQYGIERGDGALRVALADALSPRYGAAIDPELMIISNGNSQAIDWCCAALTRPGDVVLVEDPTYFLARNIFADHGLRVVGLPMDDDGLLPDALAAALTAHRPAFVYTVPTYANPTGITTSAARRAEIVQLIARHGSLLVADEVYHLLSYGEAPPPSYGAWLDSGVVVCLGTFSKILAPGLRLGWVQAAEPTLARLEGYGTLVSGGGLNPFAAPIVTAMLQDGSALTYLDRLRTVYAARVATLDAALHDAFGSGGSGDSTGSGRSGSSTAPDGSGGDGGAGGSAGPVSWRTPDGGYFFWMRFPADVDTAAVRPLAVARGAAFQPGAKFSTDGGFRHCLRLSFAYYGEDDLVRAVHALADAFAAGYPDLHLEDRR